MANQFTRPSTLDLRFNSSTTGEHILDYYLEACEQGGKPLPELLTALFNADGELDNENFQFRVDPLTRVLQSRFGVYIDPNEAWRNVAGGALLRNRGEWAANTAYEPTDLVSLNGNIYLSQAQQATPTFVDANWAKLIDFAHLETLRAEVAAQATQINTDVAAANTVLPQLVAARDETVTAAAAAVTAKTDAQSAKTAAQSAMAIATNAKTDAENARNSAQNFQSSANAAKVLAETAQTAAEAAKTAAQASEAQINIKATQINTDVAAANTVLPQLVAARDATVAAASATTTNKTAAESAQTAAQTARTGAETAQTAAQGSQTAAQTARTAAQTAQTAAETAKTAAEAAKTAAQTSEAQINTKATQISADVTAANAARDATLAAASTTTANKAAAETAQTAAQSANTDAQSAKTAAETAKTAAETAQAAAETARTGAEAAAATSSSKHTQMTALLADAQAVGNKVLLDSTNVSMNTENAQTAAQTAESARALAEGFAAAANNAKVEAEVSRASALSYRTAAAQSATDADFWAENAQQSNYNASTASYAAHVSELAAKSAAEQAESAIAVLTGGMKEGGPADLSTGSLPAPIEIAGSPTSTYWKVTGAGTASGVTCEVGDTLVYSLALPGYYKIADNSGDKYVEGVVVAKEQAMVGVNFKVVDGVVTKVDTQQASAVFVVDQYNTPMLFLNPEGEDDPLAGWPSRFYHTDSPPTTEEIGAVSYVDAQLGYRNRVINGGMNIAQRGTSGAANTSNVFVVDRWTQTNSGLSTNVTASQIADAPMFGRHSLKYTVNAPTAAATASQYYTIEHRIEGNQARSLYKGNMALSFWVKSSVAGKYSVSLSNASQTRGLVIEYEVFNPGTWEEYSFKDLPGPEVGGGVWEVNENLGINLRFTLSAGPSVSSDNNMEWWAAGNRVASTSQVNFLGVSGATFQLACVQLEAGTWPTRYENVPYGIELAQCQRYYYAPNTPTDAFLGQYLSGRWYFQMMPLPVPMRVAKTTPTLTSVSIVGVTPVATGFTAATNSTGTAWAPVSTNANGVADGTVKPVVLPAFAFNAEL